jgi:integrase
MPRAKAKPAKPRPDYPLFAHASGRWCKKIKGKHRYFGPWADPDGALQRYLDEKDDWYAGRVPRRAGNGLKVKDLLNRFLTSKQRSLKSQDIVPATFQQYMATCKRIREFFGLSRLVSDLGADDFEAFRATLADGWAPSSLAAEINRVRVVFGYAYNNHMIESPVRYGSGFNRPSRKLLEQVRYANGERMFEAVQVRRILAAAPMPLKAMVLLGVNCGYGNHDCDSLPLWAVDLDGGWVSYPRPKTAVRRRCPLWNETAEALREAIATRPQPMDKGDEGLVFLTRFGNRWGHGISSGALGNAFRRLLEELDLYRHGRGFYTLRHVFETIGGDARDQVAVNAIMGHADRSMAGVYRERIEDARLVAVSDHVRRWLFELDGSTTSPRD